ncbi:MAG TPA: hypothetical protein VFE77_03085 [Rhodanobacter sp.]|nr:hypothetical protein [Rhodanobacter sp.]
MTITLDLETRSYADLKRVGAWVYSEDPTTEIICACYAIDDAAVQVWTPYMAPPQALFDAIADGHDLEAHNISFELSHWLNILERKFSWPSVPLTQWRDTMAVACYYALPAALDRLAQALGIGAKNADGGRLISKYSKLYLKTAHKGTIPADDLARFVAYCVDDVELERAVSKHLGGLPPHELEIFLLTLETNLRGLYLDQEGIADAIAVVEKRSTMLVSEFRAITGLNPTQGAKVIAWMAGHEINLDNMRAEYLNDLMEDGEIPRGPARRALEIRVEVNKASTKKLDAMMRHCGSDGRARFQTRYHGAATGRETGSGFQPLNLARPLEDMDSAQLCGDIAYRDPEWLDTCYGEAMEVVSKASRYWIKGEPGNVIYSGDYSSIEAVVLACGAGEEWKIEAFRNKAKIYELTADKIYGWAPGTCTKKMPERQDGKRCELAFGYQGALNAWLKFDPRPIHSDEAIIGFCKAWRKECPAIVDMWRNMESAATEAVTYPGHMFRVKPCGAEFQIIDEWLTMLLPDGEKRLWYFQPQIRAGMPQWHQPVTREDCANGTCGCKPVPKLSYMAQKEGHWKRVYTYGGKLTENWTQATARQIMEPGKRRLRLAGYHPILTVYDEIATEEKPGFGSAEEFKRLLIDTRGTFAQDWPIDGKINVGERYGL